MNAVSIPPRSWLDEITIDHGPADLFGRFFLKADTALRQRGITLSFGTFEELQATNDANRESWLPLVPTFSTKYCDFDRERSVCILGRDQSGRVVTTHAARFYHWQDSSLFEEAESLRFFYDQPERDRGPGEHCTVSAKASHEITGRIALTGGVWFHPAYRKLALPLIMARVIRSYCYTRWNTDVSLSVMSNKVVGRGLFDKTGHRNIDWALDWRNTPLGDMYLAMVWMRPFELFDDLNGFLDGFDTKVDAAVNYGRAEQRSRA